MHSSIFFFTYLQRPQALARTANIVIVLIQITLLIIHRRVKDLQQVPSVNLRPGRRNLCRGQRRLKKQNPATFQNAMTYPWRVVRQGCRQVQSVGPQTLQGYLDSLPESREYKEAMQSRNPKKGWKPIDGKHITSGKKVAFKPIFWDNEGRMRHGIRVRGSDKSEECWRHVEGKAPAGCTFAHSRLGDTLQFICVKCTYERGRNDWCSEKTKHKQYIFNLGAYRNLEGGIWKKTS